MPQLGPRGRASGPLPRTQTLGFGRMPAEEDTRSLRVDTISSVRVLLDSRLPQQTTIKMSNRYDAVALLRVLKRCS
jgi:hypothetical protein